VRYAAPCALATNTRARDETGREKEAVRLRWRICDQRNLSTRAQIRVLNASDSVFAITIIVLADYEFHREDLRGLGVFVQRVKLRMRYVNEFNTLANGAKIS
jgi:hypothetical protein